MEKLGVKDFINVGLFSVIYFVMFTISGILGYIPLCVVILPLDFMQALRTMREILSFIY